MELRQLRYLAAIAEHRNLGRAARALYVSQPALSYALKRLETELGVRLFDRTPAGVEPTAAGADVLRAAAEALAAADRVAAAAERHRAGGVLRVGFEASGAGELTTRARAEFARLRPAVRVVPKRFDWGGEAAALREGAVDAAFVWLPADLDGCESLLVHTEPRVVGMPAGHRLAAKDRVTLADTAAEPLMWTDAAPRAWVDWWAVNPRPDGSEPVWGPKNDNVEEMLDQVAAGAAVCFAPASTAAYYARPGLAWVPLADAEPLRVVLAWRPGHPLAEDFAAVVRTLL
ncbi:LysR family transcriptional regulator [Glycomyces terrestris]|uniref:LysR family transcriptional regulator n=1 Tax=Glycomyces terrestris TaxID=2493553 RepID=A0A426UZ19_9ACTN|nr:LysR family transcriptional regulator [Glycomyces terrestris]RRR99785.1 LysR family transcriptional regulator [Glycomyces terrestris]